MKILRSPHSEFDYEICPNCGKDVPYLLDVTGWCANCSSTDQYYRVENYLARIADHLEHYIIRGYSFNQAIDAVRFETRPTCYACGGLLSRAPRHSLFCTKNERCRQARHRYHYLYKMKGYTKAHALSIVIGELNRAG